MKKPVYRGYRPNLDTSGFHHSLFDVATLPEPLKSTMAVVEPAARKPFVGVTTDGSVVPGLFELMKTGADMEPVIRAASDFIAKLSTQQRAVALLPMDDYRRRLWCNAFMPYLPHGVLLEEASHEVRQSALLLMKASFSAKGYNDTRLVMQLNALLGKLIGDNERNLTEWMYWITLFGTPSPQEPWGWQLEGHHLDINVTVIGDQIVITPSFLGAEPRISDETEGPFAGLRVFDDEESRGLELIRALSAEQQRKAILYPSMLSADLPALLAGPFNGRHLGGAGQDNLILPYAGIAASDLDSKQRDLLLALVGTYVARLPETHGKLKMAEVVRHLDSTYFAWIGKTELEKSPFYYRIHSPVLLIEFDHHAGIFLDNQEPERHHAHTIIRTPNGNDYGIDLLRQHYERYEHTPHGHVPRRPRT